MGTRVSPLASLDARLARFRQERSVWFAVSIGILALSYLVVGILLHLLAGNPAMAEHVFASAPAALTRGHFLVALVIALPPMLMTRPRRPTQEDVDRDLALRRAAGLDDSVR